MISIITGCMDNDNININTITTTITTTFDTNDWNENDSKNIIDDYKNYCIFQLASVKWVISCFLFFLESLTQACYPNIHYKLQNKFISAISTSLYQYPKSKIKVIIFMITMIMRMMIYDF